METNNEDIQASVGAGNIAVPDVFEIALSPIFGVAPFKVPARFRYRIEDRKLKLGFRLQRIEDVMMQVIRDIEAEIVLPDGVAKVYEAEVEGDPDDDALQRLRDGVDRKSVV